MRVLLFIPDLQMGGAERTVVRLAQHLDRTRFDVQVAWSGLWGMAGDVIRGLGIPLHFFNFKTDNPEDVIQLYRALRPDVYLSFGYRLIYKDLLAARKAGIRTIITRRADMRHWDNAQQQTEADQIRNSVTRLVIACSEAAARVCHRVEQLGWSKIMVIHNGVELPGLTSRRPESGIRRQLGLPPDVLLLGNTANYRTLKGYTTLLQALRLVTQTHPGVHLVACGTEVEAGHLEELRGLAAALGLSDKVSFLPEQTNLDPIYGDLDLFIQSSVTEGLSNSLLEAMSWGIPVVATAVGGTAEAIAAPECGSLIPHSDENAMAQSILALVRAPERRALLGKQARARIEEHFTVPRMIAGYESAFQKARHNLPLKEDQA